MPEPRTSQAAASGYHGPRLTRNANESSGQSNMSVMATPHGATFNYQSSTRMSRMSMQTGASTHDLEMMILRRVDRVSKVEIPVDMDMAFEETGFGKFQYCLWVICGFMYACCSLSTTTLSFVLPAAACDFNLTAADKGLLNIMPVAGMMIGSYVWGSFADSKGRKFVLVWSLLIDGFAGIISSFMPGKIYFLVMRIFNGFGIIGCLSVVFAYLGEFLDDQKRDKILSSLELFWTLGIITEPVIGYFVIPMTWEIGKKGVYTYNSWRLYVFLCGLPSIVLALTMMRMPESPRFLLLQGKLVDARKVLERIYCTNTKKDPSTFPVKLLMPSAQAEYYFFKSLQDISTCDLFKETLRGFWKLHIYLFRNCLKNIILTSYIDFGLMCCYNTLVNWIPEILNNIDKFEQVKGEGHTLCDVEQTGLRVPSKAAGGGGGGGGHPPPNEEECDSVSIAVYIETFLVCLCCIPTTVAVLFFIQHVSKKVLLVISMGTAAVVTELVHTVKKGEHVFLLMCMFEAFTTVVEAILFCIVVEIFPDQVRGIALCLTVTIGRLGAVVGNMLFGAFITTNCVIPFYIFVFLLITSCFAVLLFPPLKLGH